MNINDLEAEAIHFLTSEHRFIFEDLVVYSYKFLQSIFNNMGVAEGNKKKIASSIILSRVMQDLRCVHLCAIRGYPGAAGTLAASIWELSYEIGYINLDDYDIEMWFSHNEVKRTETRYDVRIKKFLETIYKDESERNIEVERSFADYSFLSAFKHGNSITQLVTLAKRDGVIGTIDSKPNISSESILMLCRIIFHACEYAIQAAKFHAMSYIPEGKSQDISPTLEEIYERLRESFNYMDSLIVSRV